MSRWIEDLADALAGDPLGQRPLQLRTGQVTAVGSGTVTVTIGGSSAAVPGVRHLASYATPQVGDTVALLVQGASVVVLGRFAPLA